MTIEIITVELEVPQALIASGGIESYATAKGWTPTITTIDAEGNEVTESNPVAAIDFARGWIRRFVRQDFERILTDKLMTDAALTAREMINNLFEGE